MARRIIHIEEAVEVLCSFIRDTDSDTIAAMFSETFGYEVEADPITEMLICTEGTMCGHRLDQADVLIGAKVCLQPNSTHPNSTQFEGTVIGIEDRGGELYAEVLDKDGERMVAPVKHFDAVTPGS